MTKSLKATIIGTTAILGGISLITGGFAVWYFTKGKKTVRTDVITSGIKFNKPTDTTVGTFSTPDTNKYYLAIDQIARPTDGTSIPTTAGKGVNFVEGTAGVTTSDDYPTVAAKGFTVTWTAATSTTTDAPYGVFYFPEDLSDYFDVYIGSTTASVVTAMSDNQSAASSAGVASGYVAYPLSFTKTTGSTPTYSYDFNVTVSYKTGMLPTTEEDYDILKNAAQDKTMGFAFGTISTASIYTYNFTSSSAEISGFKGTQAEGDYTTSQFAVNNEGSIVPVTGIAVRAFNGGNNNIIDNLVVTSNIKKISEAVFQGDTKLKTVKLPEGLTEIQLWAFGGCSSLESVNIPTTVTSLGQHAFDSCTSLKSITLPEGLTTLGEAAFLKCTSLTSVTIPSTITSIPTQAFNSCTSLTSLTLSEGITSIGQNAFAGCTSLAALTIPGTISEFDYSAFDGDKSIASLTLSEGVKTLRYDQSLSFSSALTTVSLPSTLTSLSTAAIANRNSKITTLTYGGTKAQWTKLIPSSTTSIKNLVVTCSNGKLTYDSNGKVS